MRSEVARSLTYRQRAAERMCRVGTKNPLISVIPPDERTSKHVGSRTPTATRAFRLMVFYVQRQSDAGADQALPCARAGPMQAFAADLVAQAVGWRRAAAYSAAQDPVANSPHEHAMAVSAMRPPTPTG